MTKHGTMPFGFAPETPKTTLGTSFARDYSQDFAASGRRPSFMHQSQSTKQTGPGVEFLSGGAVIESPPDSL